MRYGTLAEGKIVYAPNPLRLDGRVMYNPPGIVYAEAGYMPIVDTPAPEEVTEGMVAASRYEVRDGAIVRVWYETEPPEPEEQPPDDMERMRREIAQLRETMQAQIDEQKSMNEDLTDAVLELAGILTASEEPNEGGDM